MTTLALMHLLAASSTKKTGGSPIFLIALVGIAVIGYFFFLKPQQKKAAAARANVGTGYEVGDEVQTIGGVVGTILEINGDKYTLLTGATDSSGNIEGIQPTRIVFVKQAIARKLERVVDVDVEPEHDHDHADVEDHEEEETEET